MSKYQSRAFRAALDEATEAMSKEALRAALDLEKALAEVKPIVGDLYNCESAEEVYETALKRCGVDLEEIPPEHYRAMCRLLTPEGKVRTGRIAADAATAPAFAQRFPGTSRIVKG